MFHLNLSHYSFEGLIKVRQDTASSMVLQNLNKISEVFDNKQNQMMKIVGLSNCRLFSLCAFRYLCLSMPR